LVIFPSTTSHIFHHTSGGIWTISQQQPPPPLQKAKVKDLAEQQLQPLETHL